MSAALGCGFLGIHASLFPIRCHIAIGATNFRMLTIYQPVMVFAVMVFHKNLYGGFNTRR